MRGVPRKREELPKEVARRLAMLAKRKDRAQKAAADAEDAFWQELLRVRDAYPGSFRAIGEATGLSRQRIHQLVSAADAAKTTTRKSA